MKRVWLIVINGAQVLISKTEFHNNMSRWYTLGDTHTVKSYTTHIPSHAIDKQVLKSNTKKCCSFFSFIRSFVRSYLYAAHIHCIWRGKPWYYFSHLRFQTADTCYNMNGLVQLFYILVLSCFVQEKYAYKRYFWLPYPNEEENLQHLLSSMYCVPNCFYALILTRPSFEELNRLYFCILSCINWLCVTKD